MKTLQTTKKNSLSSDTNSSANGPNSESSATALTGTSSSSMLPTFTETSSSGATTTTPLRKRNVSCSGQSLTGDDSVVNPFESSVTASPCTNNNESFNGRMLAEERWGASALSPGALPTFTQHEYIQELQDEARAKGRHEVLVSGVATACPDVLQHRCAEAEQRTPTTPPAATQLPPPIPERLSLSLSSITSPDQRTPSGGTLPASTSSHNEQLQSPKVNRRHPPLFRAQPQHCPQQQHTTRFLHTTVHHLHHRQQQCTNDSQTTGGAVGGVVSPKPTTTVIVSSRPPISPRMGPQPHHMATTYSSSRPVVINKDIDPLLEDFLSTSSTSSAAPAAPPPFSVQSAHSIVNDSCEDEYPLQRSTNLNLESNNNNYQEPAVFSADYSSTVQVHGGDDSLTSSTSIASFVTNQNQPGDAAHSFTTSSTANVSLSNSSWRNRIAAGVASGVLRMPDIKAQDAFSASAVSLEAPTQVSFGTLGTEPPRLRSTVGPTAASTTSAGVYGQAQTGQGNLFQTVQLDETLSVTNSGDEGIHNTSPETATFAAGTSGWSECDFSTTNMLQDPSTVAKLDFILEQTDGQLPTFKAMPVPQMQQQQQHYHRHPHDTASSLSPKQLGLQ